MRLAWLRVLNASIRTKYNDIFSTPASYLNGFSLAKWLAITNYVKGNKVRDGVAIYEALVNNTGFIPEVNPDKWLLISDDFVGADERVKYNGGKMLLEFILNRYLNTTATTIPTIYILNNIVDVNGFYMGTDGKGEFGEMGNASSQDDFFGVSYSLNQFAFTIYVPAALFTTLGTNAANRENRVRNVADKYVIAGMVYSISTY
jgi:hypothetical protein